MKKIFALGVFLVVGFAAFAMQDSLYLSLPYQFDFSNPQKAFDSAELIASTAFGLFVAYLSPYIPYLKNLDSAKRSFLSIVPTAVVVALFWGDKDATNVVLNAVLSLVSANIVHNNTTKHLMK
jgi:hypothetical protein